MEGRSGKMGAWGAGYFLFTKGRASAGSGEERVRGGSKTSLGGDLVANLHTYIENPPPGQNSCLAHTNHDKSFLLHRLTRKNIRFVHYLVKLSAQMHEIVIQSSVVPFFSKRPGPETYNEPSKGTP